MSNVDLSQLPTAGGFQQVFGPPDCYPRIDSKGRPVDVSSDKAVLAHQALQLATFGGPAPWRCSTPVVAYISNNFWRVACPHCGDVPPCGPAHAIACCLHCGAVIDTITYPPDAALIEAALLARPLIANRNWFPDETLEGLVVENQAHAVAIPTDVAAAVGLVTAQDATVAVQVTP